jgi:hypothetical protein
MAPSAGQELQTGADAASLGGRAISGCCSDAHGNEPWICMLVDLIRYHHASGARIIFLDRLLPRQPGW